MNSISISMSSRAAGRPAAQLSSRSVERSPRPSPALTPGPTPYGAVARRCTLNSKLGRAVLQSRDFQPSSFSFSSLSRPALRVIRIRVGNTGAEGPVLGIMHKCPQVGGKWLKLLLCAISSRHLEGANGQDRGASARGGTRRTGPGRPASARACVPAPGSKAGGSEGREASSALRAILGCQAVKPLDQVFIGGRSSINPANRKAGRFHRDLLFRALVLGCWELI